jgi:putative molybdopterin biosynthesis protein
MTERNIYLEDIPLDDAWARLVAALRDKGRWQALPGEAVPLSAALGRITAEAIYARLSSPHYHSAAMDGYAVRAQETYGASETRPILLTIGQQAYPVNTGDPLPGETNAVIMIEAVQAIESGQIAVRAAVAPWQHVRAVGEDIVATELLLPANHRLRPVDLGALAGAGYAEVPVRRQPQVLMMPTGSELVWPGQPPEAGQIVEYNSLVLAAQVSEAGGQARVMDITPDDLQQLQTALQQAVAENPDLLLVLSGSSAGSKDYTASIIQQMGELLVHGIAVRPGHPVIIGLVAGIPVIGVPGYPVSAALTGEIMIQPLLAHWLGQRPEQRPVIQATMTRKLVSPPGDDEYVRVTVGEVGDRLLAAPLSRGAGVITSLVRADGLAHIPRFSEGVNAGQTINISLYRTPDEIARSVLAIGSHDPMLDLLAQFMAERGQRLTSANVGSLGGLVALQRREAHLAGVHLLDPETGEYNLAYVRQYLPDVPVRLVTFAHREQGLIVAAGNPQDIQSLDDLTRVRYVNRQRGAGTRLLLDYELGQRGIAAANVAGYEHEEYTHLAVAAAIAAGVADCGLGVRSAAFALNLSFVPVGWERYDLCIPERHIDHPGIQTLLNLLPADDFRQALAAQPGYDTRDTGKFV